MDKHGEFFPEQPETVEELIDALARRQAAAQRMLASLSPEQREQLGQLMSQALGDADLASQMAQLERQPAGAAARSGPGVPGGDAAGRRVARLQRRRPGCRRAGRPGGVAGPADPRASAGSTLDDVDVGPAGAAARSGGGPRLPGAARPGARAGAAGLPDPRRRRAAAHPPGRTPARPDRAAPGLRPAGRRRARRPRRPADRGRRRADRPDPAVGVRRRAADRRAAYGGQRPAPRRPRAGYRGARSRSRTSRSPRPSGGPRRRWRSASTCPSRWSRTAAGDR